MDGSFYKFLGVISKFQIQAYILQIFHKNIDAYYNMALDTQNF